MRVAALYDVHGNLPALEAVLADVPDDAVIVVGGDVAAGPFPAETLERLRALGERVRWLRGNADRELTPGEEELAPPEALEWVPDVLGWLRSRLHPEQLAFLHGLPPTVELDIDGLGHVLFCHATPRNDVDIFTERTPEERISPWFAGVSADLVVCGHTHTQFERRIAGIRVVNAGSVGMAYENSPGAYWTLLGPGVARYSALYDLDTGDYPDKWPASSREEAVEHFERFAGG
ncbi:MAG: metallophosphoesterase family protein [Gaiellaceae bacterium]